MSVLWLCRTSDADLPLEIQRSAFIARAASKLDSSGLQGKLSVSVLHADCSCLFSLRRMVQGTMLNLAKTSSLCFAAVIDQHPHYFFLLQSVFLGAVGYPLVWVSEVAMPPQASSSLQMSFAQLIWSELARLGLLINKCIGYQEPFTHAFSFYIFYLLVCGQQPQRKRS